MKTALKIIAVLLIPCIAHATALTWDPNTGGTHPQDGAGTWDTLSADWWTGTADITFDLNAPTVFDGAIFGAGNGVAGTVTLATSIVCTNVTFNAAAVGNYTIAGGGNTLGITNRSFLANVDGTISASIVGSGITLSHGAANAPSGVLMLSGNNTFTNLTLGENANNENGVSAPNSSCAVRPLSNNALGVGSVSYNSQGNQSSPRIELSGGVTVTNPISATGRNNPSAGVVAYGSGNIMTGVFTRGTGGADFGIASEGANSLTLSGATGTNNIALASAAGSPRNYVLRGAGSGTVSGNIANNTTPGGNNLGIIKAGSGTWTFSGANTFTNLISVDAGTLRLDYTTQNNSKITTNGLLTLGGGTLNLNGGSFVQPVGGVSIAQGASAITQSSGSSILQLNTMSRLPGGTVDFGAPSIAETTTPNINGILGGYATVGGANWAVNSTGGANGPITAYSGYTFIPATGGSIANNAAANLEMNSAGGGGSITIASGTTVINTLLQGTTTAATIDTSSGTLCLGPIGGVLIPAGMQSLTFGVSPGSGTLTAGGAVGTPGELVFINNSANNLVVNSVIADNGGSVSVTKSGSGAATFDAANTYSGPTILAQGTLNVGADANFGNDPGSATVGNILISGGTLQATQTFQLNANRDISLGPTNRYGNGTISVASGQTLTVPGIVASTDTTGNGPSATLTKTGPGILVLGGANTYGLGTIITGGAVAIIADNGVGAAPTCYNPDNLVLNGGTLEASNTFTLSANRGIVLGPEGSAGSGTIGVSAGQVLTFAGRISDNWGGTGSLVKNDSGTLILNGSFSDYGGNTTVSGGTLQLANARALPNGTGNDAVTVNSPGLLNVVSSVTLDDLGGNGTIDNTNTAPESLTIGYAGDNNQGNFSGVIQNSGGPLTLVIGSGALILGSANTYSGATLINNGMLTLSGSGSIAASTNINLASGTRLNVSSLSSGVLTLGTSQSLSGVGTVQGNVADNSGSLIVPGGNGTLGTLTVSGNLTLGANGRGNVSLDLTTNTSAGGVNNDLIVVGGTLSVAGPTTVNLNYLNGLPAIGAYTLFEYSTFSGNVANLLVPPGFSLVNNTSAKAIQLVVTHVPGSLTWNGDGTANVWDTDVTANWMEGGTNQFFFTGDTVTFDDTGSATPAVNISGTVAPNGITVNAAENYTFIGGAISTGSLIKKGSGSLVLDDTNNTYAGGTSISAGALQVGSDDTLGTLGTGPVTNNAALIFDRTDTATASNSISGTGTLTYAGNGNLYLSGSNSYSGQTTISSNGTLHTESATALGAPTGPLVNTNGGKLYVDLNINFQNPLTLGGNDVSLEKGGSGVSTLGGSVGLISDTTLSIDGGATLNLTNVAGINSSNVPVNLTLAGSGTANISGPLSLSTGSLMVNGSTWSVAPNNSYTGLTTINSGGGLLIGGPLSLGPVPGSFNASDVTLNGGTLGTSTNVTLDDGNIGITVSDVANTSRITVNGTNSTFILSNNISGDTSAVLTKTGSGTLVLAGANTYSGALIIDSTSTSANDGKTIIANNGALANVLASLGFPYITIGDNNGGSSTLGLDGTSGSITIAPDISLAGRNNAVPAIENITGSNTISGAFTLVVGGSIYAFQSDSGILNLTSPIPYMTPNSGRTFTFQGPGSILMSGAIVDGNLDATSTSNVWVNVVQAGPGLLTMSAANTYSGFTTVSNGILSLPGSLNSIGGVTVAGGLLVGNGSITGPVAVQAGGTIEAGTTNVIGTLSFGNTLSLSGNTVVKINGTSQTGDQFTGQSSVTYGGTLTVTNLGGALALGNHFTLFSPGTSASNFGSIIGKPGPGLAYNFANGVLSVVTGPPTTPTNITAHVSGNVLTLSWPSNYQGWILQEQTNSANVGLSTNWFDVPGSGSVTSTNITINPANPTVFFRLHD
ncbi:MAG TPA: autotransporter-associated beta strand repeat-containing protein [Verrucomicrobiae bacterium]|nr:autotransporter-associated beta strand repeat-containing protein [Verrucomicrobiae bacterium]